MWSRLSPLLIFTLSELWRRWGKIFVTAIIFAIAVGWLLGWWGFAFAFACFGAFYLATLVRQLFQFARRVKQFHEVADAPIKFLVAPEILDDANWRAWAEKIKNLQSELTQRFGLSLRRTLAVFVFPTISELSRLFRTEASGFAFPKGDAISLAWDALQSSPFPDELILHELAHLFSAYIGKGKPNFKREGFAVWVEGSVDGKPVDFHALVQILSGNEIPLLALISDENFNAYRHATYPLAGSFTGYLVQRFGWENYRRFYAAANAKNFEPAFEKHFGITLTAAEQGWKRSLMERRNEFEPELSSRVRREHLELAYRKWQFWLCIEEAEALLRDGEDHWRTIWTAAVSYALVGNYQRALKLMLQLAERDDVDMRPYQVNLWRMLGNLYDLLGQRDKAVAAYQKALELPDWWDEEEGSTHAQVRQYLNRPFTGREVHERLRRRLTRR